MPFINEITLGDTIQIVLSLTAGGLLTKLWLREDPAKKIARGLSYGYFYSLIFPVFSKKQNEYQIWTEAGDKIVHSIKIEITIGKTIDAHSHNSVSGHYISKKEIQKLKIHTNESSRPLDFHGYFISGETIAQFIDRPTILYALFEYLKEHEKLIPNSEKWLSKESKLLSAFKDQLENLVNRHSFSHLVSFNHG